MLIPCAAFTNCKLKVNGKGSVKAIPDKATAALGVVTENMQLEVAQRENAERIAAVINTLIGLGIPKEAIQTQAYQIQPQYDFVDGRQVFRGYRVTHNLKVDIYDITMVGRIIDAAVKAGANTVSGIDFTVSDPARYYKAALNEALNDAAAKAASIGMKLNVRMSPIPAQIVEETQPTAAPFVLAQAAVSTTPVQPGQIEITASIEAIFYYSC